MESFDRQTKAIAAAHLPVGYGFTIVNAFDEAGQVLAVTDPEALMDVMGLQEQAEGRSSTDRK
jgi:hypothetical protein